MNTNHLEALALTQQLAFRLTDNDFAAADIVVLPPFTALRSVQTLVQGDKLKLRYGAQDVSPHSDGEDDALVNAKVRAALAHEITPILCIGEPLPVRQAEQHIGHAITQLDG